MSLEDVILPKRYKNAKVLFEQDLDPWRSTAQDGFATANLNLTQLARDCFSVGYEFDNDGLANKTTSLEDRINLLAAGGAPISGTSNSTWAFNTGGNAVTLSASLLTAARTFQYPDSAGTLDVIDAAQTLTNKTITAAILSGTFTGTYTLAGTPTLSGTFLGTPTFPSPLIGMVDKGNSGSGTVTCDCSLGSKFLITATASFTLAFSNFTNGQRVEVWILQSGAGSFTVTWPTDTRWMNGTGATDSTTDKPTLTTTTGKFDIIWFEKFDAVGTDGLMFAGVKGYKGAIT